MNAAKILARCSRLIGYRGLSTVVQVGKGRLPVGGVSCVGNQQTHLIPLARPAYSTDSKFEVMNIQDAEDFQKRVLESTKPIVVDFHATWCGPCKLLAPRLESRLGKEGGKVLMAKVDIDEFPELAMEYGVRSVPTVVGMINGKVQNQFIGMVDDDQMSAFVEKLVVS